MQAFIDGRPPAAWLEVHSENFFSPGSRARDMLLRIRDHYPVSLHGVGLSIGSVDPLDHDHLRKLQALVDEVQPALVSEHLSWGSVNGRHLNDLLPMPYTEEAADHFAGRVAEVQDALGREILIENLSSYIQYRCSEMSEQEFLVAVARRSGCKLLLDINNIYVNVMNHGGSVAAYIDAVPRDLVREIHLAGHSRNGYGERGILVDTHGTRVCPEVWEAYAHALRRFGRVPTLIEWDTDIPSLALLLDEAARAQSVMEKSHAVAA